MMPNFNESRKRRIASVICLSITVTFLALQNPGYAQAPALAAPPVSIAEKIDGIIESSPASKQTFVGVVVLDAETGEVLYNRYGSHLFTPASNVKMYTSARALALWGADQRFETALAASEPITAGKINGDLILRGGGDPILKSSDLRAMARRVADEFGLREVAGDLVIDLSLYSPILKGPGWMWDDDPDEYQMSVTPLMLDYNVMTVSARPSAGASGGISASLNPSANFPSVVIHSSPAGVISIDREPFSEEIIVTGGGPEAKSASRSLTMHNPGPWIGSVFHEMLKTSGVKVGGSIRVSTEAVAGAALFSHWSAPLSEIIALFNKPSENAIGEVLLLNFGAAAGKIPSSWRAGANDMSEWLQRDVGLSKGTFRLVDGSGLSRYNLITAEGTAKLLRYMWQRPDRDVYLESLTIAGVDGTARNRMKGTAAEGRVFCKSGTMSGVSCLSGYVKREGEEALIFSILTNGYVGSSGPSRTLQNNICIALAEN